VYNNDQLRPATTSILRLREVLHARGRSRSSHYLDIKRGVFTRPVLIGTRAVGWPAEEVEALNRARIAGKSEAEIRTLVAALHAARSSYGSRSPTSP
jgi:prophage regulatory protein